MYVRRRTDPYQQVLAYVMTMQHTVRARSRPKTSIRHWRASVPDPERLNMFGRLPAMLPHRRLKRTPRPATTRHGSTEPGQIRKATHVIELKHTTLRRRSRLTKKTFPSILSICFLLCHSSVCLNRG